MRVFVSGVAGFLGSHVAETFLRQGHTVVGCDILLGGELTNVPEGVEFHEVDCCDPLAMGRVTRGAELVYHCAAVATEGLSVFSPAIVSQHTYLSTAGLLAGAIGSGVHRFVFCSSMARYGEGAVPFVETQAPAPVDPYGVAKFAAELLVANLCETHGVEYVIAVPHNIYGPRQKYDDPYRNVAGIMINRVLQGRPPVIYGDGMQTRAFSHVRDCVEPLIKMGCLSGVSGEVFNIGPDEAETVMTVRDLAFLIIELMDAALEPTYVPARTREVRRATCSADKARAVLGYRTRVGLREGLAETIAWIRARGARSFRYYLPVEISSPLVPTTWTDHLL